MKKAKPSISIEKSVFTLNINGKKLLVSIEDLRVLQNVISNKLNPPYVSIPYSYTTSDSLTIPCSTTITAAANISIGDE